VVNRNPTTPCVLPHYFVKTLLSENKRLTISYKQECGCLVHFVRLATTLLSEEEISVRDTMHILAGNFANYRF